MNRLFWKIFLTFWLALIAFAGALLFATSSYLDHLRAQQEAGAPLARMRGYVEQGQVVAEREGAAGLRRWAEALDRREAIPFLLVDAEGQDLLGRPVPPFVAARLNRERMHGPPGRMGPRFLTPIRLPDGTAYRLMPDFQSITLGRILQRPRVIAVPLIVAALVSALACLLLSRSLTRPLERLRRATQQFAAGDLAQRVGPGMGRRRDEIADLALAFDRMAERLEQVFGAQRQLLRDASHELRSPLARLQVALGLARRRTAGVAGQELDRIEREAERLDELIGQILSLSRLEAGVDALQREPVDLAQLLRSLAEDARFEAAARGCTVETWGLAAATVAADPRLLRSAVENVVRNAMKYTAPGSAVEIALREDAGRPGWAVVEVRDHGPGVPEADLAHLFEPFVRVGEARDRASGGYGLGLAIAERAVRRHGGEIWAANAPDGGLRVEIRLPLAGGRR